MLKYSEFLLMYAQYVWEAGNKKGSKEVLISSVVDPEIYHIKKNWTVRTRIYIPVFSQDLDLGPDPVHSQPGSNIMLSNKGSKTS